MTIVPLQWLHTDGDTLHSHDHPHVDHWYVLIFPIFLHNKAANKKK